MAGSRRQPTGRTACSCWPCARRSRISATPRWPASWKGSTIACATASRARRWPGCSGRSGAWVVPCPGWRRTWKRIWPISAPSSVRSVHDEAPGPGPNREGRTMNEPNAAAGAIAPDRLEGRIADAKPTYGDGEAAGEANRCLYCHDAPCVTACPTGIDIPGFIRKIATGNVRGSARAILSANLLGYSCARVCPVEVLCVGACVYNDWHRYPPIQIGRLQRYAVETAFANGSGASLLSKAAPNGKKVACVGAGPASLAAAGYLALEGVAVTLYEKRKLPGGLNTSGVAPYKMHVDGSLLEVGFIQSLGVTIREGAEVGRDVTVADLLRDYG